MGTPLKIFNRYSGTLEEEPICGEWFLRFAYGTLPGRLFQSLIGSRPFFSRLAARYAKSRHSAKKILPFIRRYAIPMGESLLPIGQFASFDDFFTRRLRPEARPIAAGKNCIIAPADGRYTLIPDLSVVSEIPIKGQRMDVQHLTGDREWGKKFHSALIARLCPLDYHRFHFPCDCVPGETAHLPGRLHSVHPLALAHVPALTENRRCITPIATAGGGMAMVEVGATFIGSITQTHVPHLAVKKGMEKGYFSFGGSTLILLFAADALRPSGDIARYSAMGIETYVRHGDAIGNLTPKDTSGTAP